MATNGKKYKFVVDCEDEHCKTVQAHMRNMGFDVRPNPTSLGDHYGVKRFSTAKAADAIAGQIFDKFSKKIYQIAVLPEA